MPILEGSIPPVDSGPSVFGILIMIAAVIVVALVIVGVVIGFKKMK